MQVIILGGSGLIGRKLGAFLSNHSYDVTILSRNPQKIKIESTKNVYWNGNEITDIPGLKPPYAFVNLAGENLAYGWWVKSKKEKLLSSRVNATQALSCFIRSLEIPPEVVIQGSAIGFYDNSGRYLSDESYPRGTSFLSDLVDRWEKSMDLDEDETKHLVYIRTGVVFDPDGGAFPKFIQPIRNFAGGKIGIGEQMISWIHWEDEVRAIEYLIRNPVSGIFNLVAPEPVSQYVFLKLASTLLRRPTFFRFPSALIKLAWGEKGETIILKGEHVIPKKLEKTGFRFKYPNLRLALENLLDV